MKSKWAIIALLAIACTGKKVSAQSWSLHLNVNETFPLNNELKGQYPILWYSSDEGRGVLLGGFGAGISHRRPLKGTTQIKLQVNGQRSRFYDIPAIFTDENGITVAGIIGINTNLNASAMAMPQFSLLDGEKLLLGTGLGLRGTFYSRSNYGDWPVDGIVTSLKLRNKSLSPVVLFLPVELAFQFGRISLAVRGELGLTRASRLQAYAKERSFWLFLEAGYQL